MRIWWGEWFQTVVPGRRNASNPEPGDHWLGIPGSSYGRPGMTRSPSHNPDRHIRQALELARQHIALHDRADVFGRAGINDVAGLQLERLRQFGDLFGDAPDHLVEIGGLSHRAVDGKRDRALAEMSRLRHRVDRADHGAMVETLA